MIDLSKLPNLESAHAQWQTALSAWQRAAPSLSIEYRHALRLSIRDMAQKVETAPSLVCHTERRQRVASIPSLLRLERLLRSNVNGHNTSGG